MKLRNARLCLDCEEVHDAPHCPACASESFAFIKRWVPTPSSDAAPAPAGVPSQAERSDRPVPPLEPTTRETLDTYRQLLSGRPAQPSSNWRFVKRGAVGLALFGLAGWAWKQGNGPRPNAGDGVPDEND